MKYHSDISKWSVLMCNLFDDGIAIRQKLLAHEAMRWVGIKEVGGNNRGQIVEMFQKAVDGKASGEPWCLAFTMFCVNAVDDTYEALVDACVARSTLVKTEHCLTLWDTTPSNFKCKAKPGTIAIWQHGQSTAGHAGIVVEVGPDHMVTVEGNTSDGTGINRDGDGVFKRKRKLANDGEMRLLGFIRPWA